MWYVSGESGESGALQAEQKSSTIKGKLEERQIPSPFVFSPGLFVMPSDMTTTTNPEALFCPLAVSPPPPTQAIFKDPPLRRGSQFALKNHKPKNFRYPPKLPVASAAADSVLGQLRARSFKAHKVSRQDPPELSLDAEQPIPAASAELPKSVAEQFKALIIDGDLYQISCFIHEHAKSKVGYLQQSLLHEFVNLSNLFFTKKQDPETAIIHYTEVFNCLLEHDIPLSVVDDAGNTPLHRAMEQGLDIPFQLIIAEIRHKKCYEVLVINNNLGETSLALLYGVTWKLGDDNAAFRRQLLFDTLNDFFTRDILPIPPGLEVDFSTMVSSTGFLQRCIGQLFNEMMVGIASNTHRQKKLTYSLPLLKDLTSYIEAKGILYCHHFEKASVAEALPIYERTLPRLSNAMVKDLLVNITDAESGRVTINTFLFRMMQAASLFHSEWRDEKILQEFLQWYINFVQFNEVMKTTVLGMVSTKENLVAQFTVVYASMIESKATELVDEADTLCLQFCQQNMKQALWYLLPVSIEASRFEMIQSLIALFLLNITQFDNAYFLGLLDRIDQSISICPIAAVEAILVDLVGGMQAVLVTNQDSDEFSKFILKVNFIASKHNLLKLRDEVFSIAEKNMKLLKIKDQVAIYFFAASHKPEILLNYGLTILIEFESRKLSNLQTMLITMNEISLREAEAVVAIQEQQIRDTLSIRRMYKHLLEYVCEPRLGEHFMKIAGFVKREPLLMSDEDMQAFYLRMFTHKRENRFDKKYELARNFREIYLQRITVSVDSPDFVRLLNEILYAENFKNNRSYFSYCSHFSATKKIFDEQTGECTNPFTYEGAASSFVSVVNKILDHYIGIGIVKIDLVTLENRKGSKEYGFALLTKARALAKAQTLREAEEAELKQAKTTTAQLVQALQPVKSADTKTEVKEQHKYPRVKKEPKVKWVDTRRKKTVDADTSAARAAAAPAAVNPKSKAAKSSESIKKKAAAPTPTSSSASASQAGPARPKSQLVFFPVKKPAAAAAAPLPSAEPVNPALSTAVSQTSLASSQASSTSATSLQVSPLSTALEEPVQQRVPPTLVLTDAPVTMAATALTPQIVRHAYLLSLQTRYLLWLDLRDSGDNSCYFDDSMTDQEVDQLFFAPGAKR